MKFFFRKKDEPNPVEAAKKQRAIYKVTMTGNDYTDMRQNSATLKVWLPESVENHLDELTTYLQTSVSDLIRQILFQHLYGRYDLIGLVERQKFDAERPYSGVRFSVAPPLPGAQPAPKKVVGTKVFIPEQMKNDLDRFAGSKYQTVSEYVRDVIMTHIYGVVRVDRQPTQQPPERVDEGFEG